MVGISLAISTAVLCLVLMSKQYTIKMLKQLNTSLAHDILDLCYEKAQLQKELDSR